MTVPDLSSRWNLMAVTIRSFRGVAGECTYRFDGHPGLLYGCNGVGKSTVAHCIQWTLFGKFPAAVLANTSFARFLAPVTSGQKKNWFGQVTLARADQRLVITRDEEGGEFSVVLDSECYEGDQAERMRDTLLGLDMQGFVRTVLLHQSRIRGLLLDSPKDRNAALDRLIGMDDIEEIFSTLRPKDFSLAAGKWRAQLDAERDAYRAKETLLIEQRDAAQRVARGLKFSNKDFNETGLRKAYAALSDRLVRTAEKYGVTLAPLPTCDDVSKAREMSAAVGESLKVVRTGSEIQERLTPIDERIATLSSLLQAWISNCTSRDQAQAKINEWEQERGQVATVTAQLAEAEHTLETKVRDLKGAGALRQLLEDARSYLGAHIASGCPVCDRPVSSTEAFAGELGDRIERLGSDEIARCESEVAEAEGRVVSMHEALGVLDAYHKAQGEAQKVMDESRKRVVEELGGKGIVEKKVELRLKEEAGKLQLAREAIAQGVAVMEEELEDVELPARAIQEALVPVLHVRADLATLEDNWRNGQASHDKLESAADTLDVVSDRLVRLRKALLAAKDQLASDTLGQASPRANELYQKLVRHPVFDTLEITTTARANKIDYAFEVSTGGIKKTVREARLVLSDGQLTATALGLLFALTETTDHGLDLLYIDDPTQNLDLPCKEAMARIVVELARDRQVIVATQDEDFVSNLEAEGFFDRAVIHHLKAWDGDPSVETTSPS